jgi:hypothetical protein
MGYQYDYPHRAVTVDVVVFNIEKDDLKVLLIQRELEPFERRAALQHKRVTNARISDTSEGTYDVRAKAGS